jgi:hypothetical protein
VVVRRAEKVAGRSEVRQVREKVEEKAVADNAEKLSGHLESQVGRKPKRPQAIYSKLEVF